MPRIDFRAARAQLRLGDVTYTVPSFMKELFPPIGFVSNDLDLYTSTRDSFALLKSEPQHLLPRVTMYFDDLLGCGRCRDPVSASRPNETLVVGRRNPLADQYEKKSVAILRCQVDQRVKIVLVVGRADDEHVRKSGRISVVVLGYFLDLGDPD